MVREVTHLPVLQHFSFLVVLSIHLAAHKRMGRAHLTRTVPRRLPWRGYIVHKFNSVARVGVSRPTLLFALGKSLECTIYRNSKDFVDGRSGD